MVEVDSVAQIDIQIGHLAVHFPFHIPILCERHAHVHYPAERHTRIFAVELAYGVGHVALSYRLPQLFEVGSFGQTLVNHVYRE